VKGEIKRFSTTTFGAEVTGPFVFEDASLLYSVQHPSRGNPEPYDRAGVGYFKGFQFELDGNNDDFDEVAPPETEEARSQVRSSAGDWEFLGQEQDPINGGEEMLGVAQTPDGEDITGERFAGDFYAGNAAYNPDCNEFVPTNEDGTEGYLFTNWENSPGVISRIPLTRDSPAEWSADLENATNIVNTEAFREIGGTRINCYGDRSPWNTMISAEENYAHPRVSFTHTVGDIVEAGTGAGIIGAAQFWNRPNPTGIQDAVNKYFEDWDRDPEDLPVDTSPDDAVNYQSGSVWEVQGYWALGGTEFLAYYLGADPVDQAGGNAENTMTPIGEGYPNLYRYGYFVDVREPTADPPQPIKYYVMGRASWEAPDIQADKRTVYGCSDGDSKGIYKFVADEPIDGYDDPMDLAGTLYAPKITTQQARENASPAEVSLDIEWMELGHATNEEVESWIAQYDDVSQVDYLESHSSWEEGDEVTEEVLAHADFEVMLNGNQDYVTNEEIVEWATQWEQNGPDGVDEDLRKVPFLETRAAAKEIGASIEFNKAEGVDSVEGAGPGDYVYFGISEFNDDMSNETGDIQMQRVDGGVVYRGVLEDDYNISTLEPVIVGPDASDPADVANDALINVDNVYVMDDGRVLCCEDADQYRRSYPNDCLYVYTPEEEDTPGQSDTETAQSAANETATETPQSDTETATGTAQSAANETATETATETSTPESTANTTASE
jgi:secreted PhoX family phosphatase